MAIKIEGLETLNANLRRLARLIPEGEMAKVLEAGGEIIAKNTKKNIAGQGLVKSGALLDSVQVIPISPLRVDIVVGTDYAAVHEFGLPKGGKGIHSATAKQIRFFWAKWLETGEGMWKALALKKGYTIPPRPYFQPAIKESVPGIVKEMAFGLVRTIVSRISGGG